MVNRRPETLPLSSTKQQLLCGAASSSDRTGLMESVIAGARQSGDGSLGSSAAAANGWSR
jgi:hypothetical protein